MAKNKLKKKLSQLKRNNLSQKIYNTANQVAVENNYAVKDLRKTLIISTIIIVVQIAIFVYVNYI